MDELHNRRVDMLDQSIENALRSLPTAEPPAGLLQGIMAQVQPRPAVEMPVFRIGWMDFALSLFFAGMIGMAMLLSYKLPEEIRVRLSLQMRYLELLHFDWMMWVAVGLSLLACIAAGVVFTSSQFNRGAR